MSMTMSFNATITSSNSGNVSQVGALKYIIRHCSINTFDISYMNADGTRRTETQMEEEQNEKNPGKKTK